MCSEADHDPHRKRRNGSSVPAWGESNSTGTLWEQSAMLFAAAQGSRDTKAQHFRNYFWSPLRRSFQSIHGLFLDAWRMHKPPPTEPCFPAPAAFLSALCNCPERKKKQRKCDRAPSSPCLHLPTSFINWVMVITSLEIYLISPSRKKNQEVWLWQAIRGYSADEQLPITERAVGIFDELDLSNGVPKGRGSHHSNQSSCAPLRSSKWSRKRSAAIDRVGGHENGFR